MHEVYTHNVCCDEQKEWFEDEECLVLDGYQPEPEKPKYYSGKAVCIVNNREGFTKGRTYDFHDGYTTDDDGDERPVTGLPIESPHSEWFSIQFVELKQ